jgi:hypothetical protein
VLELLVENQRRPRARLARRTLDACRLQGLRDRAKSCSPRAKIASSASASERSTGASGRRSDWLASAA